MHVFCCAVENYEWKSSFVIEAFLLLNFSFNISMCHLVTGQLVVQSQLFLLLYKGKLALQYLDNVTLKFEIKQF